ncbi:MAG: glycosyltransferase [Candidatus Manganitrophus sp.]|nr:glycosyltransferase [Candidatus Manganitrophus sp.]
MSLVKFVFWLSFFVILYTYIGYPLVLSGWRSLRKQKVQKREILPSVSVIVAVYNEERVIERKLKNLFDLNYPASLLEIIVSSDGSTDQTEAKVSRWKEQYPNGPSLLLLTAPAHIGKAAALNRAVAHARGEILLFTDARQLLDRNAASALVSNFADDRVGAVSGELILMIGREARRRRGSGCTGGTRSGFEKWKAMSIRCWGRPGRFMRSGNRSTIRFRRRRFWTMSSSRCRRFSRDIGPSLSRTPWPMISSPSGRKTNLPER